MANATEGKAYIDYCLPVEDGKPLIIFQSAWYGHFMMVYNWKSASFDMHTIEWWGKFTWDISNNGEFKKVKTSWPPVDYAHPNVNVGTTFELPVSKQVIDDGDYQRPVKLVMWREVEVTPPTTLAGGNVSLGEPHPVKADSNGGSSNDTAKLIPPPTPPVTNPPAAPTVFSAPPPVIAQVAVKPEAMPPSSNTEDPWKDMMDDQRPGNEPKSPSHPSLNITLHQIPVSFSGSDDKMVIAQACSTFYSPKGFCKFGRFCRFGHSPEDFGKRVPREPTTFEKDHYRIFLCPGTRFIVNGVLSKFGGRMLCKMFSPVVFITTSKQDLCFCNYRCVQEITEKQVFLHNILPPKLDSIPFTIYRLTKAAVSAETSSGALAHTAGKSKEPST